MLEVRRAMRRERIFRDRTNPLEIYDVLELIERFRCNETSVFVVSHELVAGYARVCTTWARMHNTT
jgi:hypothetical protein